MKVFYGSIDPPLYQLLKGKGTPLSVNNLGTVNCRELVPNLEKKVDAPFPERNCLTGEYQIVGPL